MEFQRTWALSDDGDAISNEAIDATEIGDPSAEADREGSGESAAHAGDDAVPECAVPECAVPECAVSECAVSEGAAPDVVPATDEAAWPRVLATVQRVIHQANVVIVASVLAVGVVVILIGTAWRSSGSSSTADAAQGSDSSTPAIVPWPDEAGWTQGTTGSEDLPLSPAPDSGSITPGDGGTGITSADGLSTDGAGTEAGTGTEAEAGTGTGAAAAGAATTTAARRTATVRIVGLDGKCLGAAGGGTANGTTVDVYSCVGDATQTWSMYDDGTVRTGGKCMEVAGGATADGTRVQLYSCNGTAAQRWTYSSGYDLVNPRADKCLDLKDRSSADYTVAQIWTCNGASNQKWTLS